MAVSKKVIHIRHLIFVAHLAVKLHTAPSIYNRGYTCIIIYSFMFFKRISPTYRFNCCTCIYFDDFVAYVGVILMELSKYARIGKAPFIKAIGVQKNHTETIYTEHQELDVNASGCFSCPNYKYVEYAEYMPEEIRNTCKANCQKCPNAVYKTVTTETHRYINEKNRYGYAPRLKAIAIKLLLIYHFCQPDERGIVKDLSVKQLADLIGCTQRSIKNANTALTEYGYICISQIGWRPRTFCIKLSEYNTYALTADKGGRGYATFNKSCLLELLKLKDLNQLRIFLRAALEIDTERTDEKEISVKETFSSLRLFLPMYCKPGIIRNAVSRASNLFKTYCTDKGVMMTMKNTYHGRNQYEKENKQHTAQFKNLFNKINDSIAKVNDAVIQKQPVPVQEVEYLDHMGIKSTLHNYKNDQFFVDFKLEDKDFNDLGILATTFGYQKVKEYIGYIYENYTVHLKMNCIGALLRTILKKENLTTCVDDV